MAVHSWLIDISHIEVTSAATLCGVAAQNVIEGTEVLKNGRGKPEMVDAYYKALFKVPSDLEAFAARTHEYLPQGLEEKNRPFDRSKADVARGKLNDLRVQAD